MLAVGYPPLDATTVVRRGPQTRFLLHEGIVMQAPHHLAAVKAGSDLEPLGSRQRQHGMAKHRLKLVKHRLTQPCWNVPTHASNYSAYRVVAVPDFGNQVRHSLGSQFIRRADQVGVNRLSGDALDVNIAPLERSHTVHPCHNLNAAALG